MYFRSIIYDLIKTVKFVSRHLSASSHDLYINIDDIYFDCFRIVFVMVQGWDTTGCILVQMADSRTEVGNL